MRVAIFNIRLPFDLVRASVFVVACSLAGGCIAIKVAVHVADAERALNEAREYGAQDMAAYEYTMAMRYLEKAKEEITYNDYRISEDLSKKSQEWSDKAIIFIQRGGRMDLSGEDFGVVPDDVIPEQVPIPDDFPDLLPDGPDDLWEATTFPDPVPAPEPAPEDDFDFDDEDDFEMESP